MNTGRVIAFSMVALAAVSCEPDSLDDTVEDSLPEETGDTVDTVDTVETGETGETGDTDDPPLEGFWDTINWTNVTDLDVTLDMDNAPTYSHWEIRMCTSPEGWGLGCDVYTRIAWGISSLGLAMHEDGLVLTGMPDIPTIDEAGVNLQPVQVHAFSTPDLEHWGTHIWSIETTAKIDNLPIDVTMWTPPDGDVELVYYSMPIECTNDDPLLCPGPHSMRKAVYEDGAFVEVEQELYAAETLTDPTVCHDGDTYHMVFGVDGYVGHAVSDDGELYVDQWGDTWGGANVPYCFEHDDQIMAVAQGGGGWPPPVWLNLDENGQFPEESQMLYSDADNLSFFGGSCTSPVLAYFQGLYVTFCAVQVNP